MIEDVIEIYQLIIESTSSRLEKSNYSEECANYCIRWGRIPEALALFHKKMKYDESEFAKVKQTTNSIRDMLSRRDQIYQESI